MKTSSLPVLLVLAASGALACGGSAQVAGGAPAPQAPTPPAAEPPPAAPAEDSVDGRRRALEALLTEHWEYTLEKRPEFASMLGDKRYNDRWSDLSFGAIEKDLAATREHLSRFEAIDTTGFPEQEALNQKLMVRSLREHLEGARFEPWLMPVSQLGIHVQLPRLVPMLVFTSVKDYEDYLTRLRAFPVIMEQTVALMRAGKAKDLMPPRNVLALAVTQAEGLSRQKVEESPWAQPTTRFPETIPEPDRERLRGEILAAIRDQVLPAYESFTTYLRDEYAPHGRPNPGVWSLPDGAARYAFAVKTMTTSTLSPDEIHELGLREVARIESEQEKIGRKLGHRSLAAFRKHIRGNRKLYAKSGEQIVELYQRYTDQMYARIPELFGRLPKQKMVILPIEKFREKEAAGAEYNPGTQDGSRPGMVRVNTHEPTKRLTIDIESTAYHEGVPGHHMQLAIQQELPDLPPFRQHGGYGAFVEGWALYSEALGKEVGFFEDPYSDYGRLQDEMLRAIRLVVDTGFHHRKWTRDQVVKYFHDHSTIDEPSVQSETDRYMVWPAQALSYKVGQLTILQLREKARAALGDGFDIRAFHDQVLGAGALPLDVLEERINAWIAEQKPQPGKEM
jgi:uncharacterized protein (DUF885 family)